MYTTFQGLKQQSESTKHATINPHEILKQLHTHMHTHTHVHCCVACVCKRERGGEGDEMRIAIKNEWPKESNCKRSKAKNCTINKTMAPQEEAGMGEERRQKGVRESSGVCFILCDFDMQLMPKRKRERERGNRRETRTFLRAKESFQSETTTWLKPKVLHTHTQSHGGFPLLPLLDCQSMYASIT